MDKHSIIKRNLKDSLAIKNQILEDEKIIESIAQISSMICNSLRGGGKVLFCGNGGSAADAQHLAAELSGRYYYDRPPLFAEALHVNSSYLTAVANDISFDQTYARLIEAIGKPDDILIGMSTSGNSVNVVNALISANEKGMTTIAFAGVEGGKISKVAANCIRIPSSDTPRIQECHMLLGHAICELVEAEMFPKEA